MEKECIHCGECTRKCDFLNKYHMDLGDTEKLEAFAYHCFLCGECEHICPAGIDGRERFLDIRKGQIDKNNGKIKEKGYDLLIKEKAEYIFRNYKNITSGRVLFSGCNFPSFFPKTMKYLASLLRKEAGIGTIYDCCGKPIAELGLEEEEKKIITGLNKRLHDAGVNEVIMLCPNCYYFLKDRLDVKVTDIYSVLKELGIGNKIEKQVNLFLPCPDKKEKLWLEQVQYFITGETVVIDEIQCCGLGGCARGKEPEISKGFTEQLQKAGYLEVHTFCASCSGKFARDGMKEVSHMLVEILGTEEEPDVLKSILNRTMSKLW